MKNLKRMLSPITSMLLVIILFVSSPITAFAVDNNDVYALSYHVGSYDMFPEGDGSISVTIDGTKYFYSDDYDNYDDISNNFNSMENQNVLYELHENKIVRVYSLDNVLTPKVTVEPSIKEGLIYRNGKFSQNSFDVVINVSNRLTSTFQKNDLLWFLNDNEKERLYTTLKKLEIEPSNGVDFGSSGWWLWKEYQTNISENFNDNIKVNETKEYHYTVNLQNDKVLNQKEYDIELYTTPTFDFGTGERTTSKIKVGNLDYQEEKTEEKKANSTSGKSVTQASTKLAGVKNALQFSKNLLNSDQTEQVNEYVNLWISELILARYVDKSDIKQNVSEQIANQWLSKLGLDTSVLLIPGTIQATTYLKTQTKDGTQVFIELYINLTSFDFGNSGMPTMATGSGSATIYNMNGEQLDSSVILPAYADVCAFCEQLQKVAKDTIFNGAKQYRTIFGIDTDATAEALSSQIMAKLLNSKYTKDVFKKVDAKDVKTALKKLISEGDKKCGNKIFELVTTPSQNSTLISVKCPVDVTVYDNDGNICGMVRNNVVDTSYGDVFISVVGDQKNIYLIGDDYTFTLSGTDSGKMDYVVTEFDESGTKSREITYSNIELSDGCNYYSYVPEAENHNSSLFDLTDSDGNVISATTGMDIDIDIDNQESSDVAINVVDCNIGDIITYTYYLKTPGKFEDFQGSFNYSSGLKIRNLKFADNKGVMSDISKTSIAYYNGTSVMDPYDFTESRAFFSAEFEVIGDGEQTIKNNMYIISGIDGTDYYSYGVINGCEEKFETKVVNAPTTYGGGIYLPKNDVKTNRYFLKLPVDEKDSYGNVHNWMTFSNATATCFWWEGTDACESWQKSYRMKKTDLDNIFYIDVPDNVHTVIFSNGIYGGEAPAEGEIASPSFGKNCQTVNVCTEYYEPKDNPNYPQGTASFDNMIYIVDVNNVEVSEYSGASIYGGEWKYLHEDGSIDYTAGTIFAPKGISVTTDKTAVTLKNGASTTVKATVKGGDLGYTTDWKSDNPDVAEVDETGKITAKNKGTATITVRVQNPGNETDVAQAEIIVNVVDLLDGKVTGTTGDCTWTYEASTQTLTISGNGEMGHYEWSEECPWRDFRESIKEIVIEDGVTSIGYWAFYYCTSLTSVTIPDSVTIIEWGAFFYCTSLTSVTIPNSVTSIGIWTFDGCTSLTSVTIGNGVTSIGEDAFNGCTSLTSVTIPDSVTSIGRDSFYNTAIYNNQPEGVVYIDNWLIGYKGDMPENTEIVIKNGTRGIADGAFEDCTSLTSVTIGNGVTSIGEDAFEGCTSLTSVTIPDSVTSIGEGAFSGCTSLTNITIPDSVTSIHWGAYSGCTSLTGVTIPDSVTSIGGYAFGGCTSLTNITIPDSVTSIGEGAFSGCTSLTSVTIPDSVTSIGDYAFGYYYNDDSYKIKFQNFTIYGYKGTSAEKYAADNEFNFVSLDTGKSVQNITGYLPKYEVTFGDKPFSLNAKAETALSYASDNTSVAEVSADGTVTIKGSGKATITITAEETANYKSATATVEITVNKAGQEVSVDKQNYKLTYGAKPFNLNAKAETALSYVSGNPKVAYVSADGTVTIKGAGTATITITADETENYNSATATVKITVAKATQRVTGVKTQYVTSAGKSFILKPKAKTKLTYTSSNKNVAVVSSTGKVTVKAGGYAYITVKASENGNYKSAYVKTKIISAPRDFTSKDVSKVKKTGKTTAKITWKSLAGAKGYTVQLATNKTFKGAKTVKNSKNTATLTGLKKGKTYYVRINAYTKVSGKNYSNKWYTVKFKM